MLTHEKQIDEYEKTILKLKAQSKDHGMSCDEEIGKLEGKLTKLKDKVYSELSAWDRVAICRHPNRPRASDFIKNMCDRFVEIFGDRLYADDHAIITGFGEIKGQKVVIIAQEKGNDTDSRLYRNFGMPHPEGYRKALRAMKLAEKFGLPVVSLLDTPGAYPGLTAEERGQGWAIANNLLEMAGLMTPIVVILIGEGCSGGALGMGVGDEILMLEHAYYSVISPEGCASILWHDSTKNEIAAKALNLHVEKLIQLGIVDGMIEEPQGGAHHDAETTYHNTSDAILKSLSSLQKIPLDKLVDLRYEKFRKMGEITTQSSG
ncbi:MAG: Acetyl-coenzyme A carboxylase carboxyl transferase subunit alpha [Chlamydiia bacterium]|nr:Acetyl-coenzyme A carboxylase carboxyl transferase subunit alpha [Chlamydiia bacterium]MCH9615886.1 Acetyl-coenzyme A carboxylase carboxyl transferase subunit alpha [Chlamydiia bacterium]MCH9628711.1 Acetyl-coenzyme A carboxylase carboxyl transferase subunit alpha [Chlamydiia bacterium]